PAEARAVMPLQRPVHTMPASPPGPGGDSVIAEGARRMPTPNVRRLPASIRIALLAGAVSAAAPALAQDVAAPTAHELDTIVVTGRAGAGMRTKAETSYSITNIEEETLRLQAPTSVTEAMKSVPGFWVEASGGEASGNIRARGVPVDGFGSVQLLEDGMPIQHDPALGYLHGDQAFRLDETIERIEVG